ncbi:MAG: addiction module antidote protein [Litorimonas sp.]
MSYPIKDPDLRPVPHEQLVVGLLESSSADDIALFLQEALETGDTKHFARCVGYAAKAVGMTEMSERTGMKRPALYRLTDGRSKPRLDTILKVVEALGVKMKLVA